MKELQELKEKLRKEEELRIQKKEPQQGQIQQGVRHGQIDEAASIQVVDSSKRLTQSKHGEKSQQQDFSQEIARVLEKMDTNMEQPELDQDIEIMPYHQELNPPTSLDLEAEQVLSD